MTPSQIIERVKLRFDVLYYSDKAKLEAMMKDSMGAYQDKAGAVRKVMIESPATDIRRPKDLQMIVASSDGNGNFITCTLSATRITPTGYFVYPVTVNYLVNFRELGMSDDVPDESIGLIQKHFEASLNLRNTRLERNVAQAASLQRDLPAEDTLQARIDAVEQDMEESQAIIPMITVM